MHAWRYSSSEAIDLDSFDIAMKSSWRLVWQCIPLNKAAVTG